MGNPVRPWRKFLTAWERLDEEKQAKLIADARRTLTQLRAHRKDIESRIAYWEGTLEQAQTAKRKLEWHGRARERYERVDKNTKNSSYRGKFTRLRERAASEVQP